MGRFCILYSLEIEKKLKLRPKFQKEFPKAYSYYFAHLDNHIIYGKMSNLEEKLQKTNFTLTYTKEGCQVYDLCRHLRNSLCHSLFEITEDGFYIIDTCKSNRNSRTSSGYLKSEELYEFIEIIVNEYENRN